MQHYGLKTILIDFTSDVYTALWFATSDIEYSKEDFSIFTFEFNEDLKYNMDFKEEEKIYYCPHNNKRGFTQRSYFLLGNIDFKKQ